MSCQICTPSNPYNEFEPAYYDYKYVGSEYANYQCSCSDEQELGSDFFEKEILEEIKELKDVSDLIGRLESMDPSDQGAVESMISGIVYEQEEEDEDGYDGIRFHSIKPSKYRTVDDYVDLLRVLRGDFENLVPCERLHHRVHGSKDPSAVMEMMKTLVEGSVDHCLPREHEAYEEHFICTHDYFEARLVELHVVYEEGFEEFTFVIDRADRRIYVKA